LAVSPWVFGRVAWLVSFFQWGEIAGMSKPPDEAKLYEAALNHLARYAATEAGMARVLARKIDRWARLQGEESLDPDVVRRAKSSIPAVIARLTAANVLNDETFAQSRARRLTREGKSRRLALAHLAAKGVAAAAAQAAVADDPARELAAACAFLRRRRAGPFGDAAAEKVLGAMARAGFSQSTARAALRLDREEAEGLIKGLDG
jgi:regulatory protein